MTSSFFKVAKLRIRSHRNEISDNVLVCLMLTFTVEFTELLTGNKNLKYIIFSARLSFVGHVSDEQLRRKF